MISKGISLSILANDLHCDCKITSLSLSLFNDTTFLFDLISISKNEEEYGKKFFQYFESFLISQKITIIMYDSLPISDILYHQYGIKFKEICDLKVCIIF